jgi:hypothetical protein
MAVPEDSSEFPIPISRAPGSGKSYLMMKSSASYGFPERKPHSGVCPGLIARAGWAPALFSLNRDQAF